MLFPADSPLDAPVLLLIFIRFFYFVRCINPTGLREKVMECIRILIIRINEDVIRRLVSSLNRFGHVQITGILPYGTEWPEITFSGNPDLIICEVSPEHPSGPEWLKTLRKTAGINPEVIRYRDDRSDSEATVQHDLSVMRYTQIQKDTEQMITRFTNLLQPRLPDTFLHRSEPSRTVFIQTAEGYRFIDCGHIVLFLYHSGTRSWELVLSDQRKFKLQRRTNARTILNLAPVFIQVNQSTIINISYLVRIENYSKRCIFYSPFDPLYQNIFITRNYYDKLRQSDYWS